MRSITDPHRRFDRAAWASGGVFAVLALLKLAYADSGGAAAWPGIIGIVAAGLAAAGLFANAYRRRRLGWILGLPAALAAGAALVHGMPSDAGLALQEPAYRGGVGRVIPLAALLSALGVLAACSIRWPRGRVMVVASSGALVLALGIGWVVGEVTAFPLDGGGPRLEALLVGLVVVALGTTAIITGRRPTRYNRRRVPFWKFVPFTVAVACGFMLVGQFLHEQERASLRQATQTTLTRITDQLRVRIEASGLGLHRMARAWAWRGRPARNDWKTDAWLFVEHYEEVRTVAWVDPGMTVQWLSPLAGFHELQGLDLGFEARRRDTLRRAQETGDLALSMPLVLPEAGTGFIMAAPIEGGPDADSAIVGFYEIEPLLSGILANVAPGYFVTLLDGEDIVHQSVDRPARYAARWNATGEMVLHGARWRLKVAPEPATVRAALTWVPSVTLAIGLAVALLVGVVMYQGEVARMAASGLRVELRRRSRVQAALRRSQRELEDRVEARTRDLNEKQRELEASNAELERLATTDSLTGTCNRRRFHEHADREFRAARRYRRELALLMFDLDHFKAINDRLGHEAGDEALRETARVCQAALRDTDCIARFGGEEFVVLLPETGAEHARSVAERMREAIEGLELSHRGEAFSVTASFGAATLQPDDGSPDDLVRRADDAVYAAKQQGRNRVVCG